MTDLAMSFVDELPDSPAGQAARWMFDQVATAGVDLTAEEFGTRIGWTEPDGRAPDIELFRERLGNQWRQLGERFAYEGILSARPEELTVVFVDASGKRSEYVVQVDPEPPHVITGAWMQRALPPGMGIRLARPEDGPALREVAAGAPMRLGEVLVSVDPGDDYFAGCRLMGDHVYTYVVTHEDRPVGIHCGVSYPVRFAGQEGRFFLIAHSRVLPEYAKGGVWSRLNSAVFGEFFGSSLPHIAGLAYVRPENEAAQRLNGAESRWSVRPFRAVLDCAEVAGEPRGRPATPDDADRVVDLLNGFHDLEELFLPYTPARLDERLHTAPDLYSWSDLLIGDRAVVGVWRSGEVRTFRPDHGSERVERRAVVLDHGCEPGAEDELVSLLRAWCAQLATEGFTHLGVFTSPASRASDVLRGLACAIEEYDLMPPGLTEPPTTATSGIYVDPVYF